MNRIPPPRNILVSFHYFKNFNLDRFAGLRVIADSGAFSAKSQGAEITTADLAAWAGKWRHRLCWVAALDVIGDAEATRRNWHDMVDTYGLPGVPTIHYGSDPALMDYYVERGVDFIGLGGMVGKSTARQMRWLIPVFRYQQAHHPQVRFHGWGASSERVLKLPFFSVDSSGWSGAYRYGRLILRDPNTGRAHTLELDGRTTYAPHIAKLLTDGYGVTPAQVATSGPHNRLLMVRLAALSASAHEQAMRRLHARNPITAPAWGLLDSEAGPHCHIAGKPDSLPTVAAMARQDGPGLHLASSWPADLEAVAALRDEQDGPHMHLAVRHGSGADDLMATAGPHMHLAEGSSEHLEVVARMNGEQG